MAPRLAGMEADASSRPVTIITGAVAYLFSHDAAYTSGADIRVAGGN